MTPLRAVQTRMRRAAGITFTALLLTACASGPSGGGSAESGIRGTVIAGPQCPVVQENSPCPDEPVDGAAIEVFRDGVVVQTATSGADGTFEIGLDPGTYEVRAVPTSNVGMSAKPVSVVVEKGVFAAVDLVIDTGIR